MTNQQPSVYQVIVHLDADIAGLNRVQQGPPVFVIVMGVGREDATLLRRGGNAKPPGQG